MSANANRQEANTTSAYERTIIDAVVEDAEAAYAPFDARPSDGIRGAIYNGVVADITTRANEELAKVGRPTHGPEADAFRAKIIAGIILPVELLLPSVLFVGPVMSL